MQGVTMVAAEMGKIVDKGAGNMTIATRKSSDSAQNKKQGNRSRQEAASVDRFRARLAGA